MNKQTEILLKKASLIKIATANAMLAHVGAKVIMLDRIFAHYGPEGEDAR